MTSFTNLNFVALEYSHLTNEKENKRKIGNLHLKRKKKTYYMFLRKWSRKSNWLIHVIRLMLQITMRSLITDTLPLPTKKTALKNVFCSFHHHYQEYSQSPWFHHHHLIETYSAIWSHSLIFQAALAAWYNQIHYEYSRRCWGQQNLTTPM